MFGRFFALEMGCPDEDTYLHEGEIHQGYIPEGVALICECRGLGCPKCKRKKAKIVTLIGDPRAVPVMNMQAMPLPLAPWTPQMIMMGRSIF